MIPFLHLGPLTIPTFGLMVACAMIGAYFLLRADIQRRGIAPGHADTEAEMFIAIPCLAGIAGAKIYHDLQSPAELFAHPVQVIFSAYGFAWFGGLLAGFAAFVWLARRHKIPLLEMMDAGSPAAALGYGIGRIGCLLSGDGDYGVPTSLPWGMSFPNGLVPTTQRVHPTPIYEFIAACFIAWLLWRLGARQIASRPRTERVTKNSGSQAGSSGAAKVSAVVQKAAIPAGIVFAAYLLLTGLERFLVEFIRINPRTILGMSNAQAASVLSMIVGAALWWRLARSAAASRSASR